MGRRILITRPKAQAEALIEAVAANGDEPVSLPFLAIQPVTDAAEDTLQQALTARLWALDTYNHIIFISTNAVDGFFYWLNHETCRLKANTRYYAIGRATQEKLQQRGVMASTSNLAMNSEALLTLDTLQKVAGQPILIVRGGAGREYLKEKLTARGARVDYMNVYHRQPVTYPPETLPALYRQNIDFIVVGSGETIQQLWQQAIIGGAVSRELPEKVRRTPIVVPGSRVGGIARELGFSDVREADNAGVSAVLETINR